MLHKEISKSFEWPLIALAVVIVICSDWIPIRSQTINYRTYGQNFSPYVDGQDPNFGSQITEQQLRDRMQIVAPYTQWIRTFGTTDGLEKAGLVARSLGLKVAIGAWLGPDTAANERQIANLISIAQAGQCDLAIVGSEVLLRGDLSEAQLIDYVKRVRQAIPAGIPVTTADVYGQLLAHPNVIAIVDVVMANFYPYWEGTRIDLAMGALHARYGDVKAAAGGKPVLVSESGWPSGGNQQGAAVPSPENASFFFLNFVSWARANNVQYFYFESLDESWKARYEGPQGAHWGIWDKDGNLKPGMQNVFDGKTIPDNWTGGVVNCDPSIPNLRFTHVPPYGSFDNLAGQVCRVKPADFRIVVYIKVGSGWWVKPFANQPLTTILNDGSWTCDITTGGIDETATEIVAYLVPNGFSPPILLGSPSIPATLDQNSVAKADTVRCTYAIAPSSQPFSSGGGTGSVAVTTVDNRCDWTGVSNDSWIVVTSGSSGSGNGTVRYTVAANTGADSRTGTLTIAGKTLTVTQAGIAISCGQTLTGNIQPEQLDRYTFAGNVGERVRVAIDEVGAASFSELSLSLYAPSGALVGQASGKPAVIDSVALPATGTYTIVVSSIIAPTNYNVSLVFTTGRCGMATICGQTHLNRNIQRAQLDPYLFSGNAGERVRVAIDEVGAASFSELSLSLYAPSGALVGQASGKPAVIDSVALPATGTYTIVVSSIVAPTNYNVSLVFTTGRCGTAISCNQPQSNRSIQRGQLDPYLFSGNAGGLVRVAVEEVSPSFANLAVSLYTPSGALAGQALGKPAVINNVALPATGTYTVVVSSVVAPTAYNVGLSCSGFPGVPILVSEETSTRAIALDSVLRLRDPFKLTSPVPWGVDRRTRVMLFAMNFDLLPGENISVVTADAEDASHRIYPLIVEYVGKVPEFDWMSCVIVRLNDEMGDIGDVLVRLTARGVSSNRVRMGIGHIGGGPLDDPGAVPTPGRKP
jgi:exo-beta-1,3-glucanase (GH17 family)